ncbi:uncharacterized protein RBU33_028612 [Hipposideros larvatus]
MILKAWGLQAAGPFAVLQNYSPETWRGGSYSDTDEILQFSNSMCRTQNHLGSLFQMQIPRTQVASQEHLLTLKAPGGQGFCSFHAFLWYNVSIPWKGIEIRRLSHQQPPLDALELKQPFTRIPAVFLVKQSSPGESVGLQYNGFEFCNQSEEELRGEILSDILGRSLPGTKQTEKMSEFLMDCSVMSQTQTSQVLGSPITSALCSLQGLVQTLMSAGSLMSCLFEWILEHQLLQKLKI